MLTLTDAGWQDRQGLRSSRSSCTPPRRRRPMRCIGASTGGVPNWAFAEASRTPQIAASASGRRKAGRGIIGGSSSCPVGATAPRRPLVACFGNARVHHFVEDVRSTSRGSPGGSGRIPSWSPARMRGNEMNQTILAGACVAVLALAPDVRAGAELSIDDAVRELEAFVQEEAAADRFSGDRPPGAGRRGPVRGSLRPREQALRRAQHHRHQVQPGIDEQDVHLRRDPASWPRKASSG